MDDALQTTALSWKVLLDECTGRCSSILKTASVEELVRRQDNNTAAWIYGHLLEGPKIHKDIGIPECKLEA